MVKHNNAIQKIHLRKHWQKYVKTFFDQPAKKRRRNEARKAKAAAIFPRPLESLRPVVRCQTLKYKSKVKQGRGFTLQELKEAKLGVSFAKSIGISVDHRRKNVSKESLDLNKQRLQAYVSKMVLYPKKENTPKKGLVADSAKEVIDQFGGQQNKSVKLLGNAPYVMKRRIKPVKIDKNMKDFQAYKFIRVEKDNAKKAGARAKRAEEAANKDK